MKSVIVSLATTAALVFASSASAQTIQPMNSDNQVCYSSESKGVTCKDMPAPMPSYSYDGSQITNYVIHRGLSMKLGDVTVECEVYDETCAAAMNATLKAFHAKQLRRGKEIRAYELKNKKKK